MPVHAAKTGMVSVVPTIEAIAGVVRRRRIAPLVVDPVMVATTGASLLRPEAVEAVLSLLFPLAALVTPNLPEAEKLADLRIAGLAEMKEAARRLHRRGPGAVLVKGGHLEGPTVVDLLYDGERFHEFAAPRIATRHTHGTGCALSAAVAARLARGEALPEAVLGARDFVRRGLEKGVVLGKGTNPVNHLA
jgi:hydroxymethylpyrimidine/phosphomethylpyrimidine kinase